MRTIYPIVSLKVTNLDNGEVLLTPPGCGPENYYEVSPSLFTSLLTVPELPSPMSMTIDEVNKLRANQFKRSRLLSLPRELIDEITSHLWIASSSSPVPELSASSESIVTEATDLIALALSCRYFLSILHPTVRRVLESGAAAPWAGKRLRITGIYGHSSLDGFLPDHPTGPECYSVVIQVLQRLRKDEERHRIDGSSQLTKDTHNSQELLKEVFERDIMGMTPKNAVKADCGSSDKVTVVRDLYWKHYLRMDLLPSVGLPFSLIKLADTWRRMESCRSFPAAIRVDIRTLSSEELEGWTDTPASSLQLLFHQQ